MKLRQKLAMVLAASMAVTAVPVVTFAKSEASITASNPYVIKKGEVLNREVVLEIEVDRALTTGETFYVELSGAEFVKDSDGYYGLQTEVSHGDVVSSSKKEIGIKLNTVAKGDVISLTFPEDTIKVTSKTAAFNVIGSKNITSETVEFVTTETGKAVVSLGTDAPNLYEGGEIAEIVIAESYAGALYSSKARTITVALTDDYYEFTDVPTVIYGERGFDGVEFDVELNDDANEIEITIPAYTETTVAGRIVLTGVEIDSTEKTPRTGDVTVKVSASSSEMMSSKTLTIATITEEEAMLVSDHNEEDSAVTITAGKTKTVTFELTESIANTISSREIEFEVDKGYFTVASIEGSALDLKGIDEVEDEDDEVIGYRGFTYKPEVETGEILEAEFELKLATSIEDSGEVTVTASNSRMFDEDLTVAIANIEQAFTVAADKQEIKPGIKGQELGNITITEAKKAAFEKGEITITLDDDFDFDRIPTVEVEEGDIIIDTKNIEVDDNVLIVPIKGRSTTPSKIVISDIKVTAYRTLPDGTWDATVEVENYAGEITLEDYLEINTQEEVVVDAATAPATASFILGTTTYVVNGETKTMDAAAYASNGRIMAPIRYVAEAFGITGNNVIVTGNLITLVADGRTIQLQVNSDKAILNGVTIQLDTKVEVVNGRSYAPLSQIGHLLGVTPTWDADTKTATFVRQ